MPLQGSGVAGCCWLATVCGEEEIPVNCPSHRSQRGESTTRHTNTAHNSHAMRRAGIVVTRSTLLRIIHGEVGSGFDPVTGAGALFLPKRADQPCETQDQQKAGEA